MLGDLIAGRYRVEAELGRGGMGVVLRAHDTRLNRTVAVKMLPADAATRNRTARSNGGTNRSKGECIRPGTPLSLEDARRLVEGHVEHYNNVRLNSAIGYITPKDMLAGRQQEIHAERDRKLEARENSGRLVASRLLREERRGPVSGAAEAPDEVDCFRRSDSRGVLGRRLGATLR
jgi:serine/threonine protein kinase